MLDFSRICAIILFALLTTLFSFSLQEQEISLWEEKERLGIKNAPEMVEPQPELIAKGKRLVTQGAIADGAKRVSQFFVCTDCHNLNRDFADFSFKNPEADASYCEENNISYLPGGTFYGMINQTNYYNDDYIKKYGDLVQVAKNSFRESIQLCAKECSSGRRLNEEELESTMHYLSSLQLSLKDVFKSEKEFKEYQALSKPEQKKIIQNKVAPYKTHHYGTTDLNVIKNLEGNASKGEWLFKNSCLSCHKNERVSFYGLDESNLSKKNLLKKLYDSENTLMTILRYGTAPVPGNKAYMPAYMEEKLSNQQVADIIAYLNDIQ